jgi:23S rRNA (uracil1939-C5)-methyltransferase
MKNQHRRQRQHAPAKPQLSSAPQLVQIEKAIYGGNFLTRVEGKATFVPLVLPGETASVRIREEKRGYSVADLNEIVTAARERIVPACRHFGTCGGCQYQHTDYATQLALKEAILQETLERSGVQPPNQIDVLAGDESESWQYRNRIRLAFDARGNPGYRSRGSSAVVAIAECPIAAPLLVRTALEFADVFKSAASQIHVEELSLFCDSTESALLAGIFVRSGIHDDFEKLATTIYERVPELTGIDFGRLKSEENDDNNPQIIGRWGQTSLNYRAAGFDYRVDNGAFFQVNRRLVDSLVDLVTEIRSGSLAWDLFAGVGLFARKLSASFDHVIAVESSPLALPGLQTNLHGTSASAVQASTLNFLRGPAKKEKPDLIVVDPPRIGLGPEVTSMLAMVGAGRITYVSCDPATLARDLRALLSSGYTIERVTLADLFPQTFHLETVVHLRLS